ncbi:MAG: glycosyltransferase [Lachnospiraceae bacterium]|nr:glycosyltransferase [Lachnospiraceae bacterium]
MNPMISIITVSLNPGGRLKETLESIRSQTFRDFEVIVKDGGSLDESLSSIRDFEDLPLKLVVKEDAGIYDAMNEALKYAHGDFVYFLNCGDTFASEKSLASIAGPLRAKMPKNEDGSVIEKRLIVYGNILDRRTKKIVASNPKINAFACYRNIPCHQACFYSRNLLLEHPFDPRFRVRADYEQFLWCFFRTDTEFVFLDRTVAVFEGGGYSEKHEHRSAEEHKKIAKMYFKPLQLFSYRALLLLTLAPLRTKLAGNPKTAGFYNALKRFIYRFRRPR